MINDTIFRAIGNIDEDLIERAAPQGKMASVKFRPWLKWALPVAACLALAVAIAWPALLRHPSTGSDSKTVPDNSVATVPPSSLSLDSGLESAACYAALEDWRGRLHTDNFVLSEETDGSSSADRIIFRSLDDLARYADVFVLIASVHSVTPDGGNIQSAIAEYAEPIGDRLMTRQWDDTTVSTGSRVLIRQQLMGGCTMDEPNNLLRVGGIYVLPLKFNEYWGAYEVAGDLDALFELDDAGKMVSHSRWEDLNQYDGMPLADFMEVIRGLYPPPDTEFSEQPVSSAGQAYDQVIAAYNASGFRRFSVEFDSETVVAGADVYMFKVSFAYGVSEAAAIAKENGAFIRGEIDPDGEFRTAGGLGAFPWNR